MNNIEQTVLSQFRVSNNSKKNTKCIKHKLILNTYVFCGKITACDIVWFWFWFIELWFVLFSSGKSYVM